MFFFITVASAQDRLGLDDSDTEVSNNEDTVRFNYILVLFHCCTLRETCLLMFYCFVTENKTEAFGGCGVRTKTREADENRVRGEFGRLRRCDERTEPISTHAGAVHIHAVGDYFPARWQPRSDCRVFEWVFFLTSFIFVKFSYHSLLEEWN